MRTLFTVTLIVELLFGIGMIAMPGTLFDLFGVELTDFSTALARVFGSALLGFVVLLWYGRASDQPDTHKTVLRSMFTYWLLSTIFLLIAQLGGLMNTMGWGNVILHAGFLIAYAVFIFRG